MQVHTPGAAPAVGWGEAPVLPSVTAEDQPAALAAVARGCAGLMAARTVPLGAVLQDRLRNRRRSRRYDPLEEPPPIPIQVTAGIDVLAPRSAIVGYRYYMYSFFLLFLKLTIWNRSCHICKISILKFTN
jgi:hypothetical protein